MDSLASLASADFRTLVLAAAVFGLTLATWLGFLLLWARRRAERQKVIRARLGEALGPGTETRTLRLWLDSGQVETTVEDERRHSLWGRFQRLGAEAGWRTKPEVLLLQALALGAIPAAGLFLVTGRVVPALLGAGAGALGFFWFASIAVARRQAQFERQLIDALELCARALRAGHPLLSSFELISEEIPEPIGAHFGEICQLQEMGMSLEQAVRETTRRTDSADMRLFAASLAINLRTGGNLAEVVDGIARVIRDRVRLGRRFRALISQTQFSKRVLLALPIIMFFVLNVLNPSYMSRLYDEVTGNILLGAAGTGMLLGWWVMSRMATLKH
jgi:tight adherence protein B